ncbi:hypothetical protein VIGAN_07159200 [Vigna angularis var. angularis]|uniref:FAE domain-containing protein n=1 Tax=Vigna angularis var. angularis TaxID=157739 RepID=A0A0S3SIZ6_PHAAN|nr:hypothetical protein VIGAN_07159200 [Vigna angularis var. angularis]
MAQVYYLPREDDAKLAILPGEEELTEKRTGEGAENSNGMGGMGCSAKLIVNHYKLRSNIKSYNLGDMGCSAELISVNLAKDLLKANPNSYALVLSTENITLN